MKSFFVLAFWFLLSRPAPAQSVSPIDSLRLRLANTPADTSRVTQLLALAHLYVFKLSELTPDLDSALLLSRQAYTLSGSLHYPRGQSLSYLTAAQAYKEKKDLTKSEQFTRRAIALLTKHGSLEDQADAYIELASFYKVSQQGFDQAIRLNAHVISLLKRSGNTLKLAHELVHRGDLYQLRSDNAHALTDLRQALALYRSIGYTHLQHLYDRLGFIYSKTGDYEAGVRYGLLAVNAAETAKDSFLLGDVCNRLGGTYRELNQPEKALLYYNRALAIGQRQHYKSTIILLAITITDLLPIYGKVNAKLRAATALNIRKAIAHLQNVVQERPADRSDLDCRMAVASCMLGYYDEFGKQYANAKPYCNELEAMLHQNLGDDYAVFIHSVLIPHYVNSGQYEKEERLLVSNEKICQKTAYLKQLAANHLWWFKLDSARAMYPAAIGHFQRYKALNDSLLSATTHQKVAQLEVQYQTQQKEQNIRLLTQQSELQQSELRQAQTTRNGIVAGIFLLTGLLAVNYNRYRIKQRSNLLLKAKQLEINQKNQSLAQSNQLLEVQQLEINQKNESLQQALIEKEWMLREIHHRVKNNLQVITSLLHSQGMYLKDEVASAAIRESQNRVHTMALIHQKLYQSDRLAAIPMSEYVTEIIDYLLESFDRTDTVSKQTDVVAVELDVTLAVPLGLIINEAVTNSLKHAFGPNERGSISVSLSHIDSRTYLLVMQDDGKGMPAIVNPAQSRSLGLSLIRGLSKQIGGTLHIGQDGGTRISLTFAPETVPHETTVEA